MKQEPVLSETLGRKLYSKKAVMIGTLLGGPMAGGYMLAKNFRTVNRAEKSSKVWSIASAAFLGLIMLTFIVPQQVPSFLFIFLYAWMGHFAAQKLQGEFLDKHEAEGGRFYSNWKAAGIGVVVAIIFVALLLAVLALAAAGFE